MSSSVTDAAERSAALDPQRSFCVTAPAGSGKTELLIQRFLALLARVAQPQEVLAITFTRKAAAEMRSRVSAALALAAAGSAPRDGHARRTYELARDVLAADARHDWNLRLNPAQLNIKTIDSFCGSLTRQMPLLSRFGGPVSAVDDAYPYYEEATRMLLGQLERGGPVAADLATLLLHFDNNWQRLEELLVAMLACRDQWLVHLGTGLDREHAQRAVERSVEVVCGETLSLIADALEAWRPTLMGLWQYSSDALGTTRQVRWPGCGAADVTEWRSLLGLLLTAEHNWRRQVTRREGFPPGKGEPAQRKAEMAAMLGELRETQDLLPLLQRAMQLPVVAPGDAQWERVLACSRLLPQLAAQLIVVFQHYGVVDHTQVSLAALDALGVDDNPTELALKLDYRLQHILVDEFQDTAVNQFELVRRLCRGWAEDNAVNPEAARTLFIVGDGMQSIYGFRDADVGLFIRAKQRGFNALTLEPITLRTNFRSSAALVRWVNETFADAFPAADDIQRGEIAYSSASAFDSTDHGDAVTLAAFSDNVAEAAWLAAEVATAMRTEQSGTVAVLVRRKADLLTLIPELKRLGIDWQARDIDSLADSVVVRDLANLCQALYNPMDRVAWLAMLRAPWCGVTNDDLLTLATAAGTGSLWHLLRDAELPGGLSEDGRTRVDIFRALLLEIYGQQERLGLADWAERAWLLLRGPACVDEPRQLEDAQAFFVLLEQIDADGEQYAPGLVSERIEKLFAPVAAVESRLELMTLHKAKGLEFDTVFIPNLAHSSRGDRRDLLLWDDYHAADGESCFMLAMDDRRADDQATLYHFLYEQRKAKRRAETARLLYVGATRAARRLYLSAVLEPDESGDAARWKPPPRGSLLATIWGSVSAQFVVPAVDMPAAGAAASGQLLPRRIASLDRPAGATAPRADEPNIPRRDGDRLGQAVGTVVHLTLERLADRPLPERLDHRRFTPWWRRELMSLGANPLQTALDRVARAVDNVLADPRGRWLLSPEREEAASEYKVSRLLPDGRLAEHVIDRVYVENQVRWVVDYKSSVPDFGQSIDAFVADQAARYRPQLEIYQHSMEMLEGRQVRCALYFTALPLWHELA